MSISAYHFTDATLRDGSPIPPIGEWLRFSSNVVMCKSGLHASRHPFDALQYAPGSLLHWVECEDIVEEQDDRLVCRARKIVRSVDATDMLRSFARKCALDVIHLWDAPVIVREYLETGDDSKCAAAEAAAEAAVEAAAEAAAWGVAWDAALAAARATARAAAWDTAWDAAWDAARAAVRAAAGDAARAVAWEAAWAAAWNAKRARFAEMVNAL